MRDHFAGILGADNAFDNENELLAYSYDASGLKGNARIVLFPKTDEHIRHILTYANRTGISIVPRGLGTNPLGMTVPDNAIVVDMKHFDKIHTLHLKENYVTVDCGMVLSDLQTFLAKHDREFCINPGTSNTATIGALIAMNQMDARSHRNGRVKENIKSIEFIDGTGKFFQEGNLDFVGLEGCGAIILRATFKIRKPLENTTSDLLTFDHLPDLLQAVDEKNQDLTVLALDYINPQLAGMLDMKEQHTLFVQYASEKGEYVNDEGQAKIWDKRENAWSVATKHGRPIIEDCELPQNKIFDLIQWSEKTNTPLAGHIGMGIMHPFLGLEEDRKEFYKFVRSVGGSVNGQFGFGMLKKQYLPAPIKEKIMKLKDEYDFNDIINRGKLIDYA